MTEAAIQVTSGGTQSSATQQVPSGSATTVSGAVSSQTPTSGGTTTQTTAAARPEYLPEAFWDATAGIKHKEFGAHYAEMVTRQAADDVRRNALPQKPEDFKVATTATFKPPEGVEFKFNEADPLWSQARQLAKSEGLSQDAFSKFVDLFAGHHVATEQQVQAGKAAEIAKLGTAGPARVTAITTWLDGNGLPGLKGRLITAQDVQDFEKLITKFSSQGAASFRQDGRVPPEAAGRVDQATYDKMTAAEKWNYSRSFDQAQFQQKKAG